MKRATEEREDGTATRKLGRPTRVNEGDKRARGGRMEVEAARFGAVEVDEDADGGVEGFDARVGKEARELPGGV